MTQERKKLSLGLVSQRAEQRSAAQVARAWNVSASRAEALKARARDMRRNPGAAQQALWERIKDKQCGFTFNREVVMGSAIVDFACKSRWLVIEVGGVPGEGGSESEATLAALRDRKLTDVGVRVLRFSERQVLEEIDVVIEAVRAELAKPFERPRLAAPGERSAG